MWEELPSYKIANACCLSKNIAEKIVKYREGNIFLAVSKVGIASKSRKDFKGTDERKRIIDGCFVVFSGDSNDNDNPVPPRDEKSSAAIYIQFSLY